MFSQRESKLIASKIRMWSAALCLITLSLPQLAFASVPTMTGNKLLDGLVSTVIYSVLGLLVAFFSYRVVDWLTPGDLSKELVEDKNVALAIVVGCWMLGVSIIIAAAIAG